MKISSLKFNLLLLLIAGMFPNSSFAQETDPILENLIKKGLEKSHSININQLDTEQLLLGQLYFFSAYWSSQSVFYGSFYKIFLILQVIFRSRKHLF